MFNKFKGGGVSMQFTVSPQITSTEHGDFKMRDEVMKEQMLAQSVQKLTKSYRKIRNKSAPKCRTNRSIQQLLILENKQ